MTRAGIFGPSLCGKTTLAQELSKQFWLKRKMKTLVLDPNGEDWGKHSVVFKDEEKFWETVWKSTHCLVIIEESSETINRNPDLTNVFTRLRHLHHILIVCGHSGASLLPVMRQQLETLYLFCQSEESCKQWIKDTMCKHSKDLVKATTLDKYEFIHYERFAPVRGPMKLKL